MAARMEAKAMADARAMDEQAERTNPIRGRGATPSMGLSQYRGGAKKKTKSRSPSPSEELVGGAMVGCGMERVVGAGKKKKGESMKEATAMGLHLGKHLHSLHGAGFYSDFQKGMELAGEGKMTIQHMSGGLRTGRYEGKGKMVIQHHADGEGEEIITGGSRPTRKTKEEAKELSRRIGAVPARLGEPRVEIAPEDMRAVHSLTQLRAPSADDVMAASALTKMKGKGKQKRAPASASDARRARGAMVSKLMKEQGMTLGEASKYIKEHHSG